MFQKKFIFLAALFFMACSPSINPALKQSIDRQLNAMQANDQEYPADTSPVGYQAGQWSQYKILDDKGQPSIVTYKLLDLEDDMFTIETDTESYYFHDVNRIVFRYQMGAPLDSIEVISVITQKDNEPPTALTGFSLSVLRSLMKKHAKSIFIQSTASVGQSTQEVNAGRFIGCSESDAEVRFGIWSAQSHSFHHVSVPMHGTVRSQAIGGKGNSELIAFGLTGATSSMRLRTQD